MNQRSIGFLRSRFVAFEPPSSIDAAPDTARRDSAAQRPSIAVKWAHDFESRHRGLAVLSAVLVAQQPSASSPRSRSARRSSRCSPPCSTRSVASSRSGGERLRGLRQRQAAADHVLRQRSPADHGRRDARHERQHDRQHRIPPQGGPAVPDPAAAGRQGPRRRVQRQDPDQRALHEQSRRAGRRSEGSRLRQRHTPLGRDCREPRRVPRHPGTPRRSRLHRRRRHREPDAPRQR